MDQPEDESMIDDPGMEELAMNEGNSWRQNLFEGKIRWYSGENIWENEPETELLERIISRFLQLLPIEKYL